MLSEEEAKERMEDADENNDGMITWEEYISDAYGIDGLSQELSDEEENAQVPGWSKKKWNPIVFLQFLADCWR